MYVKEHDIDLLACIDQADVGTPEGGKAGAYGVGGVGGGIARYTVSQCYY